MTAEPHTADRLGVDLVQLLVQPRHTADDAALVEDIEGQLPAIGRQSIEAHSPTLDDG